MSFFLFFFSSLPFIYFRRDEEDFDCLSNSESRKRKAMVQMTISDTINSNKRKKSIEVKRNENGDVQFPLNIGGVLTIESLGTIVPCEISENFHNDKYIWPVGYAILIFFKVCSKFLLCKDM